MVETGLDRLMRHIDFLRNRDVALIANHTSVTRDLRYGWDALRERGIRVRTIFTPEHGLFGAEQDQAPVLSRADFPVEVISLYGDTYDSLSPTERYCADVSCVLFDIQDIGTRYYTYVNTMFLFMKALHGKDIEFIVLDRPNPLGGLTVEGPVLKKGYESFVGILPVPVRHGLTTGELARLAVDYFKLDINVRVLEMTGWKRSMTYEATGLPWVPPSPNMPTLNTALVYPGMCLLEGTNASEGRGTTTPFEVFGAPDIHPYDLTEKLNSLHLPGVHFRPLFFRPTFNKYHGVSIGGAYIHVTDRNQFRPFLTGVAVTSTLHEMAPGFEFTHGVYEFNSAHHAFDLLTGSPAIREMIIDGKPLDLIAALWEKEEKVFSGITEEYHLYQDH
ncbi:MAG: hypothetical protein A2176_08405 [Spirochaetes bacterium RBG_13_51_14]|nr:MAG: hypothetical protein A2176_08405 [Spirochaetes bacterium RBG_13_51_14]